MQLYRKVQDEEEKKTPTNKKSFLDCHNPFLIYVHPLQRLFIDSGRDTDSIEIVQFTFGDGPRKKICLLLLQVFLIFCNKNWTAAAMYSRTNELC